MAAINYESKRQKECNTKVVRLFLTNIMDDKWKKNLSPSNIKKYMVLKYSKSYDKWIPVWNQYLGSRVQWWSSSTHAYLKSNITEYDNSWDRATKDKKKINEASNCINQADFEYFHSDDWITAQQQYIDWCADDGVTVTTLTASDIVGGDD